MKGRFRTYRLLSALAVCGILSAFPASVSAEPAGDVIKPQNIEEFTDAVIQMIEENAPVDPAQTGSDDTFCNKRLIVRSSARSLDFSSCSPVSVIEGSGIYILQFATCKETESAMKAIKKLSSVEYAEPDVNIEAETAAAGTAASKPHSWGVSRIGADKFAAALAESPHQEVKVAVVDSGVASHPFLSGRLLEGFDYIDDDTSPTDLYGHGTHVAGIVADCTPGLDVKIIPIRVLDENGSGLSLTTSLGIRYAVEHGADVINLSLSGRHTKFMDDSISYAVQKGVTVVAAAGNKAQNTANYCPAHITDAIVVGAMDSSLKIPGFSNRGTALDVVAPGVNISSTIPGNKFGKKTGTSMAAPHVAALAAMYKMQDPSRGPETIEKLLKDNARDLGSAGWDRSYGYGLAEAYKTVSPSSVTLNKSTLTLKVGKSQTLKATVSPAGAVKNLTWKSSRKKVAEVKDGKITAKKTGTATITVKTDNGKKASCKVTVTKKKAAKAAQVPPQPSKVKLDRTTLALKVGKSQTLKATVSPAGAVKKLTWKSSSKKVAVVKNGKVTAKKPGTATITVKTGNGRKAACRVTVTQNNRTTAAQALKNYKKFLEKNTKYKYFIVCYINKNSIPDMMAGTAKNGYNFVYFIDGKKTALPSMQAMGADDLGFGDVSDSLTADKITYYYCPKKNLVMYRYEASDPYGFVWEEYSTFKACAKDDKYKHSLLEFLTRIQDTTDGSAMYLHYYPSVSGAPDALGYDELLDQWIMEKEVSEADFNSLLAKKTGGVKLKKITFVRNTKKNRKKNLK